MHSGSQSSSGPGAGPEPGQSPQAIAARLGLTDVHVRPVTGGDISRAYRIEAKTGPRKGPFFLKHCPGAPSAMFEAEARSLGLMADAGLPVPNVQDWGQEYIVMDYIPSTPGDAGQAGAALAAMHQQKAETRFGFSFTTFCGTTALDNDWLDSWPNFFALRRIGRLVQQIRKKMGTSLSQADNRLLDTFVDQLPNLLPDCQPSLVHGDLWGGNLYGQTFIDPAAYYGHREVDLAMTRLFGGFSPRFYQGYKSVWPLEPEASDRVEIYNSYHLLNHFYLFQSRGYLDSALGVARRYV